MKGLVLKSTGSWYLVENTEGELVECRIKGKFRLQGLKTTNPIAVGDRVGYHLLEDGTGSIEQIEERRNYVVRKSVKLSKQAHILASNIDQALLVVSLREPVTYIGFIDRYLVAAESFRIPVVIVFNKVDLYLEEDQQRLMELTVTYEMAGYQCLHTSATEKLNLDNLKAVMKNKVTLLSGNSAVGKSTLINAIEPTLDLRIGELSEVHMKGKHTTTFTEMHKLSFGGYIIDSPGIKAFAMYDLEPQHLGHYFPEIRALMDKCKFQNCMHVNEPQCAVKEAVEAGELAESRYQSYLHLLSGDE